VPFPQYFGKHRERPLYTAADYRQYAAGRRGSRIGRCPASIVLVFGRSWRKRLAGTYRAPILREYDLYRVLPGAGVSVVGGPGAPNAALYVEELRALGARRFLVVGMAGSLQPSVEVGSLVVCTKAFRDEGTSHHYARGGSFAYPTRRLVDRLRASLDRHRLPYVAGPSWTTDAPYRETVAEVRAYRARGVVTVEMEASAVFSVARCLRAEAAALFVVSDRLDERGWEPRFHDSRPGLKRALRAAIEACPP